MASEVLLHQKLALAHKSNARIAVFEMIVFKIPKSIDFPQGIKYRAWLSEDGETVFGFDNHKPKGPHLHIGNKEIGYNYRGVDELIFDIKEMIEKEGFIYENK